MSKPAGHTHVLFVTDMSGSMANLADDVRGGFNTYVADLVAAKERGEGRYRLSVTLFDTEFIPYCTNARLADVPAMDSKNYRPRGGTALLDAVGITVTRFESAVTLADDDRVLLVIQTDGQENASSEYTWDSVRALLEEREKTGKWSIVYLGQGIAAWAQGNRFGASTQTVNTAASGRGTRSSYSGLSAATVDYAAGADARDVSKTVAATPGVVEP